MRAPFDATLGCLLLVVLIVAQVRATTPSISRASFTIRPGDEGVQTLKLPTSDHELISCTFKFSTKRRSSNDDSDRDISGGSVRRPPVQDILGRLRDICIRKTIDYWKYELCFEGEIKQVHGQMYHNLGRYSGLDGPVQVYEEGTPCEAKGERRGRRSKVEFLCDKQLRIRSVEEVATCSYLVIVGTPVVCGSTDFAIAPTDDGDSGQQNTDERWLLELAQVAKGRFDCSARTLTGEVRARPERPGLTTLEFSHFDIDVSLSSDSPSLIHHDFHVVRAPDRVSLLQSEREYVLNTASGTRERRISITSGDSFAGLLEFIQLTTRVVASTAV